MSRTVLSMLFVFVAVTLAIIFHMYIWHRLVRVTALPAPASRWIRTAIITLGVSIPIAAGLSRVLPRKFATYVAWPTFIWMGVLFYLCTLLLTGDLGRGIFYLLHKLADKPISPERRLFLARIIGGAVGASAIGISAFAMRSALGTIAVEEVSVTLKRLPAGMHGTTIVQLSDIHVGPTIGRDFIEQIVAQTNALTPDIIAITGDLVDGTPDQLFDLLSPLSRLKAKHGVYFVTGNHDYYSGVEVWVPRFEELGMRVLRNEHVHIGDGDQGFILAGVEDYAAGRFAKGQEKQVAQALAGRDKNKDVVLLAHQPKSAFEASQHDVALQLSGHTHGGQIWPFGFIVALTQPFMRGLGKMGNTQVYVNRGTGYWGPPMRLRAPAEITRVTLESGQA